MTNSPKFKSGDILLLRFPFTDLSSQKVRPALVIADPFDDDLFVAPITTNVLAAREDFLLDRADYDLQPLPVASCVRYRKLFTLHKSFVVRQFTRLRSKTFQDVRKKIVEYIQNS